MGTILRTMNISVLLRLLPPSRTAGRLAGRAELIETGETRHFADHDQMLAFLREVSAAPDPRHPGADGGLTERPDAAERGGMACGSCTPIGAIRSTP